VILTAAFAMACVNRSFPFFAQPRVGKGGSHFKIIKIKSMKDAFNEAGELLPDDKRVTNFGIILRKSRLDELPQLLNILKGDMSFVGPRPIRSKWVASQDILRQSVRPGLTGLGQVSGGNNLSEKEMLEKDHIYVANSQQSSDFKNLVSDIKLILKTPYALIKNRHAPHNRCSVQ